MSGVSKTIFWEAAFAADYLIYLVSFLGFVIVFAAFNLEVLNNPAGGLGALTVLFLLFGWAVIPLAYVLSWLFRSEIGALAALILAYIVLGTLS